MLRRKHEDVIVGYTDSDWANETDRKSFSGCLFEIYGDVISWTTRKQSTVALSSTETEYVALANACTELLWLNKLLNELGKPSMLPITIFEDNQTCISLLDKWEHKRLKHMDVKYNFLKGLYESNFIVVNIWLQIYQQII